MEVWRNKSSTMDRPRIMWANKGSRDERRCFSKDCLSFFTCVIDHYFASKTMEGIAEGRFRS